MAEIVSHSPELFGDILDNAVDYHQTGWTVCGAEDPAVIHLGPDFGKKHPALAEHSVVRVIDRYASPWHSDTLLEFSSNEITDEEYALYEEVMEDME